MLSFFTRKPKATLPPLRFHNTLSGKLEDFHSLKEGEVKMYNCGPTPYAEQHIGNMVPPILADLLRRSFELWGYRVKQVMNITDFGHLTGDNEGDPNEGDDKMTQGLKQEKLKPTLENMRTLAEKYTSIFLLDVASLGINTDKVEYPRASDYIPEQVALIKTLEEKGYAYELEDGVYFDTSKFVGYGKLGHINLAGLREGARVATREEKKNPTDFVLWKRSAKLGWESPWGLGFPGWHIECTAMIFKLLGKQIDIHTGGIEHIPIHHNNEIAQAEAATGKKYVGYWLHNAHITIDGKKISKSLRNTVYLHNITDKGFNPRAYRYWFLTGHYRTPMNFTWEAFEGAHTALQRLQRFFFEDLARAGKGAPNAEFMKDFYAAMAEDLNTAKALARVWDLVRDTSVSPEEKRASLLEADKFLGLGLSEKRPMYRMSVVEESDIPEDVKTLLAEREDARTSKNFERSDELRAQIEALGFEVKDTAGGQKLTKK